MQGASPAFFPICTTRNGAQFSPNELDSLTLNGVTFGVIHINISLDRLIQEALVATDRRAADLDAGLLRCVDGEQPVSIPCAGCILSYK
jgi:hypothetical protein